MNDSTDYPTPDYPVLPSQEPVGTYRDDYYYDPRGVYRQEYDPTGIVVPQPDPTTWWER